MKTIIADGITICLLIKSIILSITNWQSINLNTNKKWEQSQINIKVSRPYMFYTRQELSWSNKFVLSRGKSLSCRGNNKSLDDRLDKAS